MKTVSTNGVRRIGDERDIQILKYEVEKEGILKFKPIYTAIHTFMTENGYTHPQTGSDKPEDLYWERWVPQGHKEQHVWWRLKKDVNPYIRYFFEINFQTLLAKPSEVAYKGKKVSAEFIDMNVKVEAVLQVDINDTFENSFVGKMKKTFFHKVYKDEVNQHKTDLYNFAMNLQRLVKHMFEMQSDKNAPVNFEPVLGYKEP